MVEQGRSSGRVSDGVRQPCEQQPAGAIALTVTLTQSKEYLVPNRYLQCLPEHMGGGGGRGVEARSADIEQSSASNNAKSHGEPLTKLWGQHKMADW